MTLKISRSVLDEVDAHAREAYPEECCGLLIANGEKRVVDCVRMKNGYSGPKHDRYHIDPLELYRADRAASQRELVVAGIYHSHPDYPAVLSRFDMDHAFPWYSYLVVSVGRGGTNDRRSWTPNEKRTGAAEEQIEAVEG